jgi:hypothetical protein
MEASGLLPEADQPIPLYYYPPFYVYSFQTISFPQVTPTKPCMHLYCLSYILHALLILFPLIWPPE